MNSVAKLVRGATRAPFLLFYLTKFKIKIRQYLDRSKQKKENKLDEKVVVGGKLIENYVPPPTTKQIRSKRDNIEMILDVLLACKTLDRPSRIMETDVANLTHSKLQKILYQLSGNDLVIIKKIGSRKSSIKLTKKGLEAIELGEKFLKLIGESK
jgi:predicted transcriptional regulator